MTNLFRESIFLTQLESWNPFRSHYFSIFNHKEVALLDRAHALYTNHGRKVVICTFENQFVSLGGLGTIIKHFPLHLARNEEEVLVLTPYYKNNPSIRTARKSGLIRKKRFTASPGWGNFDNPVTCYAAHTDNPFTTCFIDIEGFFTAEKHPYDYDSIEKLGEDALAFSCAVPIVLQKLGLVKNIIVHANDWETALTAITVKIALIKQMLLSAKTVCTLHNSYDFSVPPQRLAWFLGYSFEQQSILQITLPFFDAPLTTVSTPFAYEIMHDPLQKEIFADHLQKIFSMNPPLGIENGLFGTVKPYYSKKIVQKAKHGDSAPLLEKKRFFRKQLINTLNETRHREIVGHVEFNETKKAVPIFFLSGRFDIMQKGYDVIFHAFSRLKPGDATLVFSPSNVTQDMKNHYSFFTDCALHRKGDITIWPFRMDEDMYRKFITGSSYLVLPSFYEPFGAASEGILHGTPVIARATGGLWNQVGSLLDCYVPSFYTNFFKPQRLSPQKPTGLLYRERYEKDDIAQQWRFILSAPLDQRMQSPLYQAMVEAAYETLLFALTLFDTEKYLSLIYNGFDVLSDFDWKNNVQKFKKVYDCSLRNAL